MHLFILLSEDGQGSGWMLRMLAWMSRICQGVCFTTHITIIARMTGRVRRGPWIDRNSKRTS
jgi:hypothetical protein